MNKLLIALVSCFFVLAIAGLFRQVITDKEDIKEEDVVDAFVEWVPLESQNFKLEFPTQPKRITRVIKNQIDSQLRDYDVYVSESLNSDLFVLTVMTFVRANSEQVKSSMREVVMEVVNRNSNNTLEYIETDPQNKEALNFKIKNREGQHILGTVIPKEKKLYLLTLVTRNDDQPGFNKFKESLQFKEENL